MAYNPFTGIPLSQTWDSHIRTAGRGGEDLPLNYGTPLPAPAAGTLHTDGRPGPGDDYQCGWYGSAGRRSILILDRPIRDVVAVVFQHQKTFGYEGHYDEGEIVGWSGASANGDDWGGDVHLHIHCLTAGGARRKFTDYFSGARPAGAGVTPIEEEDMPTVNEIVNTPCITVDLGGQKVDLSLAEAARRTLLNSHRIFDETPGRVWEAGLPHPIAKDSQGAPRVVMAGDYLRYEPAEHANTRAALAKVAVGDFDYEEVAAEIAERFPHLDPAAFAIAAADEADRRQRARLDETSAVTS